MGEKTGVEVRYFTVLCIVYTKPLECITHKVKSERNKKLPACSSPVSVCLYPVSPPSISVIVMTS